MDIVRVFFKDNSYKTLYVPIEASVTEICEMFAEKMHIDKRIGVNYFSLRVVREGKDTTELKPTDKPVKLQQQYIAQKVKWNNDKNYFVFQLSEDAKTKIAQHESNSSGAPAPPPPPPMMKKAAPRGPGVPPNTPGIPPPAFDLPPPPPGDFDLPPPPPPLDGSLDDLPPPPPIGFEAPPPAASPATASRGAPMIPMIGMDLVAAGRANLKKAAVKVNPPANTNTDSPPPQPSPRQVAAKPNPTMGMKLPPVVALKPVSQPANNAPPAGVAGRPTPVPPGAKARPQPNPGAPVPGGPSSPGAKKLAPPGVKKPAAPGAKKPAPPPRPPATPQEDALPPHPEIPPPSISPREAPPPVSPRQPPPIVAVKQPAKKTPPSVLPRPLPPAEPSLPPPALGVPPPLPPVTDLPAAPPPATAKRALPPTAPRPKPAAPAVTGPPPSMTLPPPPSLALPSLPAMSLPPVPQPRQNVVVTPPVAAAAKVPQDYEQEYTEEPPAEDEYAAPDFGGDFAPPEFDAAPAFTETGDDGYEYEYYEDPAAVQEDSEATAVVTPRTAGFISSGDEELDNMFAGILGNEPAKTVEAEPEPDEDFDDIMAVLNQLSNA